MESCSPTLDHWLDPSPTATSSTCRYTHVERCTQTPGAVGNGRNASADDRNMHPADGTAKESAFTRKRVREKAHSKESAFKGKRIQRKAHSKESAFKGKRIQRKAHSKESALKGKRIQRKAHSKESAFKGKRIQRKAHSKESAFKGKRIQRKAHSKESASGRKHIRTDRWSRNACVETEGAEKKAECLHMWSRVLPRPVCRVEYLDYPPPAAHGTRRRRAGKGTSPKVPCVLAPRLSSPPPAHRKHHCHHRFHRFHQRPPNHTTTPPFTAPPCSFRSRSPHRSHRHREKRDSLERAATTDRARGLSREEKKSSYLLACLLTCPLPPPYSSSPPPRAPLSSSDTHSRTRYRARRNHFATPDSALKTQTHTHTHTPPAHVPVRHGLRSQRPPEE